MTWLADLIPSPDTRIPPTRDALTHLLLPTCLCYYATAVLVQLPRTLYARLALLPVSLWYVFRTGTTLDLVGEYRDDRLLFINQGLTLGMFTIAIRCTNWTFRTRPLYRTTRAGPPQRWVHLLQDALDLLGNLRGIGWTWSKGLYLPPETRPTHSRTLFILYTAAYYLCTTLLFDLCHFSVQGFSPETFGTGVGGTIFDMGVPWVWRYVRSTGITLLSGLTVCYNIQSLYYLSTLLSMLLLPLGHSSPEAWPPISSFTPWTAHSLHSFWSRTWHQLFRDLFISVGYTPSYHLFRQSRTAGIFGAFGVSTMLHVAGLWGMGRGPEVQPTTTFFMCNALGIVLEQQWTKVTGRKVLVDAWARTGMIGTMFFRAERRPVNLVSRVVLGYDVWEDLK
ncbi:hypothetical protein MD484_g6773, partial [Candolleomyces efflorescens]